MRSTILSSTPRTGDALTRMRCEGQADADLLPQNLSQPALGGSRSAPTLTSQSKSNVRTLSAACLFSHVIPIRCGEGSQDRTATRCSSPSRASSQIPAQSQFLLKQRTGNHKGVNGDKSCGYRGAPHARYSAVTASDSCRRSYTFVRRFVTMNTALAPA